VDIFDGKTKTWSASQLWNSFCFLAATSLPLQGMVLFAGGEGSLQVQCAKRLQHDDWTVKRHRTKQNDDSIDLQDIAVASPPLWKFSEERIDMQSMIAALVTVD
jgi:hypothetical protein